MYTLRTTILLLMLASASDAQSLKVMSYNIRYDNPGDSINAWPNRIEKVASLLRKYDADIIGIQEALHHQLEDLIRVLPDYSYAGVGRDDGKEKGEYAAVLYRNSRFGLLEKNTRWLSETPDVPGSKSWDAAITRIVTITKFYDKDTKREFMIFNTHFDHVGVQARLNSASYLMAAVAGARAETKIPVVVVGDFNCERSETAYAALAENGELTDTKPPNDQTGTFCGFKVGAIECKAIDYIFHTPEWTLKNYFVLNDNDGTYYPSDHLPVVVELELILVKQ
jgi:endonuclease/exonuclease/phosphatase family metal-dependent hydrolase